MGSVSMAVAGKKPMFSPILPDWSDWGCRGEPYLLRRPNVFVGSASEGVLQPGDRILNLNSQSTDSMSHREVQDIFRNSGTMAELEVARETSVDPMNSAGDADPQVQQAKNLLTQTLSPLLPPHLSSSLMPRPFMTRSPHPSSWPIIQTR